MLPGIHSKIGPFSISACLSSLTISSTLSITSYFIGNSITLTCFSACIVASTPPTQPDLLLSDGIWIMPPLSILLGTPPTLLCSQFPNRLHTFPPCVKFTMLQSVHATPQPSQYGSPNTAPLWSGISRLSVAPFGFPIYGGPPLWKFPAPIYWLPPIPSLYPLYPFFVPHNPPLVATWRL